MDDLSSQCSVCGKTFEARFRYQIHDNGGTGFRFFCSQACQQQGLSADATCQRCGNTFSLEHAYQVSVTGQRAHYFCSIQCKEESAEVTAVRTRSPLSPLSQTPLSQAPASQAPSSQPSYPQATSPRGQTIAPVRGRRIAVFNHKGGTGKTTTAINLAAGLADRGARVLLVDADGQGNVGASLGISGERGLYHVLVRGVDAAEAAVPVRPNLFVLTSNETLAAAELYLVSKPNRDRILRDRLALAIRGFDCVIVDCAPALSLMNQNVLAYADSVIIPVGCDYLSLVGVRQVMRTLGNVERLLGHRVELLGVLPTFYDQRNRIARETVDVLNKHFGERCLHPIRVNTRLREAPSAKQTIFEYAPDCHGAQDYLDVVAFVEAAQGRGRDEAVREGMSSEGLTAAGAFMERTA